jgi:hypothetical protein
LITDWSLTSHPSFGVSIFPPPYFSQNQALVTQFNYCVERTDIAKPFVMTRWNATDIPPLSEYKDDKNLAQGGIIC